MKPQAWFAAAGRERGRLSAALVLALVVGAVAFGWPLFLRPESGMPSQLAPTVFAITLVLVLAIVLAELSGGRMDSRTLAMLGVLAAVGTVLRPLSAGTAGLELIFFVIILAGRAFGASFGFALGAITMLTSALITSGVGPWLFPEDDLSDLPQRMLAAEIVREQVLRQTHEEVPHHATVETESWAERKDGSARIDVTIYVTRATQKAILIGDGGAKIKSIGQSARRELEALLERRIHLFVNVKERAGWDEERGRIRALGLEDQG